MIWQKILSCCVFFRALCASYVSGEFVAVLTEDFYSWKSMIAAVDG